MLTKPNNYNPNPLYILDSLAISTIVGIHTYERMASQQLIFSLNAHLAKPGIKTRTCDELLPQIIREYCRQHRPRLLEKMAHELAILVLEQAPFINELTLTIKKPEALMHAQCSYVTISMTR